MIADFDRDLYIFQWVDKMLMLRLGLKFIVVALCVCLWVTVSNLAWAGQLFIRVKPNKPNLIIKIRHIDTGRELQGITDKDGHVYFAEGPPAGMCRVEVRENSSKKVVHTDIIDVAYAEGGGDAVKEIKLPATGPLLTEPPPPTTPPVTIGGSSGGSSPPTKPERDVEPDRSVQDKPWNINWRYLILIVMMLAVSAVVLAVVAKTNEQVAAKLKHLADRFRKKPPSEDQESIPEEEPPLGQPVNDEVVELPGKITFDQFQAMEKDLSANSGVYYRIGDYIFKGFIDSGGVAAVYHGSNSDEHSSIAIKMPLCKTIAKNNNKHDLQSIISEYNNRRELPEDPAFLAFLDLGEIEVAINNSAIKVPFYTMEKLSGSTLDKYLGSRYIPEATKKRIMTWIIRGLKVIHELGKLHRDIKPNNILVEFQGNTQTLLAAKIIDFGAQDQKQKLTPPYASPEHFKNPDSMDGRSDLYSAGMVFYELITGTLPFDKNAPHEKIAAWVSSDEPWELNFTSETSQQLQVIITKMVQKKPDDRYKDASEVDRALQGI